MISEKQFSHSFTSFWKLVTPTCDLFVRRLNLELYEPFGSPIKSSTAPERRGFINEIAFGFFRLKVLELSGAPKASTDDRQMVISQARKKLALLEGPPDRSYPDPSSQEQSDISDQVSILLQFFRSQTKLDKLVMDPEFPGCGIIDTCVGDVFFESALYEIKAGDRKFRSVDIRQLITYAALNSTLRSFDLASVGLFNPRQAISFEMDLDELCYEISGRGKIEVLGEIVHALSSGEVSH